MTRFDQRAVAPGDLRCARRRPGLTPGACRASLGGPTAPAGAVAP
ncbi:hypothetical protein [Streptomyces sp. NBC_01363]|nr:hypothetical protein [Streptomyces sp. NBC_01363]MCX4732853.1 hypothetical protein [Streptomyces sp. NBC_01363]